jgi:hypothetical protein
VAPPIIPGFPRISGILTQRRSSNLAIAKAKVYYIRELDIKSQLSNRQPAKDARELLLIMARAFVFLLISLVRSRVHE